MSYRISLLLVCLIVSCAPIKVIYDYEQATNFDDYKTYNYFSDIDSGLSELDTRRLFTSLDNNLQRRGYTKSENPDFLIDFQSTTREQQPNSTVGIGMGGTGRNVGGGVSVGIPVGQTHMMREIVFEFVDEDKKGMFWQAISVSTYRTKLSPQERDADFNTIVMKVLDGFPPKDKRKK